MNRMSVKVSLLDPLWCIHRILSYAPKAMSDVFVENIVDSDWSGRVPPSKVVGNAILSGGLI